MVQIRKASRKKAKLRLGICAPAGCGKTMGALLLAFGITGDWGKIGFIDTETGSGELYVGVTVDTSDGPITIGEYNYWRIDPDFTVKKYLEAIRAFEAAGMEVIIIDSLSHAWAGQGGLLDKQGKAADRTGNSYTAWREVTPEHNALVDAQLQSSSHIISAMRSKTEYVIEENDKGKKVPRKIGMAPVQRDGMEYEYTVMLDIDFKHNARATKDRTTLLVGRDFKIAPSIGRQLRDWLEAGIDEFSELKKTIENFETIPALEAAKERARAMWPMLNKTQREDLTKAISGADAKLAALKPPTETQEIP